jgi:hypothetical protein
MNDTMTLWLINHVIDTPVKLQLVIMFHERQCVEATPSWFSQHAYRDIWSIREALQELAEDGVLRAQPGIDEPVYYYHPAPEYVEPLAHLFQSYNDPLERGHLQQIIRDTSYYAPYYRAQRVHGEVPLMARQVAA